MYHLSSVILLFICLGTGLLSGADLFGDVEADLAEQEKNYNLLFGDTEKAASSSKGKMEFASQLDAKLDDADFKNIQTYMCLRILDLLGRDRSWEACSMRLHVFDVQHPSGANSKELSDEILDLIDKAIAKAPPAEGAKLLDRMIGIHTDNLRFSIFANDMEVASDSAKALDKLLRNQDPEMYQENKLYMQAIKERMRGEKSLSKLKDVVEADGGKEDLKEYVYYCFESSRIKEGLRIAERLKKQHQSQFPELLLQQYRHLQAKEPVAVADAVNCVLGIASVIKNVETSIFMDARLLNMGVGLMKIIDEDTTYDKQLKLRCKLVSESWQQQLDTRGLLIEEISSLAIPQSGSAKGSSSGRRGSVMANARLNKGDIVSLYWPNSYFWGHYGTGIQDNITKGVSPNNVATFLQSADVQDPAIWGGTCRELAYDPQHRLTIVLVGRSAVSGHSDRIAEFAEKGLNALIDQFKGHEDKLVLMTSPVMVERGSLQIEPDGERYLGGQLMNKIVLRVAAERKIPVIDVFSMSLEDLKKNPQRIYIGDLHGTKLNQEAYDLTIEAMRQFFGYIN